jgi:4-hydroxy-3-methylbut-2-enyl diphosphate reductase
LEGEGYQVLLLGDRSHAEVQALLGYANSPMVRVVSGASDLARLALKNRVGVLSQTTQRECALKELVAAVLLEVDELKVFNTICDFTTARLEAALKLAEEVDLLLVVGGQESANTRRLRDACREILPATYQIEASEEIDPDWISGKSKVGVTAGASTPEWVISGVVGRLRELGLCERPSEEPTVIPCIQKTT